MTTPQKTAREGVHIKIEGCALKHTANGNTYLELTAYIDGDGAPQYTRTLRSWRADDVQAYEDGQYRAGTEAYVDYDITPTPTGKGSYRAITRILSEPPAASPAQPAPPAAAPPAPQSAAPVSYTVRRAITLGSGPDLRDYDITATGPDLRQCIEGLWRFETAAAEKAARRYADRSGGEPFDESDDA